MPKLVRDRIPELFGGICHMLAEAEYEAALHEKLQEEVAEYLTSGEVMELADILAVAYALAALNGLTSGELDALRLKKQRERGGFTRRLWWSAEKRDETGSVPNAPNPRRAKLLLCQKL